MEERSLSCDGASVVEGNKHNKVHSDVGTESQNHNIVINDGRDDCLRVDFGDLARRLTNVQLKTTTITDIGCALGKLEFLKPMGQ